MRRRRFLASVAASTPLLAGCASPVGDGGTTRPTRATTPPEAGPIRAVRPDAQPESPFRHDAFLVGQPSERSPAKLRVRVTNASEQSHELQTNNYAFPFPDGVGRQQSGANALVLTDGFEERGGCRRGRNLVQPAVRVVSFAPGEWFERTYPVVNHVDNEACWPPGTYAFSQTYGLDPSEPGGGDSERTYSWGFDVVVG